IAFEEEVLRTGVTQTRLEGDDSSCRLAEWISQARRDGAGQPQPPECGLASIRFFVSTHATDGPLERVKSTPEELRDGLVALPQTRGDSLVPLDGKALVKRGQPGEGRSHSAGSGRSSRLGGAGQPGSNFPESTVVFLESAPHSIWDG